MARTLLLLLAVAAFVALALAPSASALGLEDRRAVSKPARAAQASSTPIAPLSSCPRQDETAAPTGEQEEEMRCMTDYARLHFGLPPLAEAEQLSLSASGKSADILLCNSFSHSACGRDFTYWMKESGYLAAQCWRAGENLAWGVGEEGTVRSIFRAWMRSPSHRQNILGAFDQIGVALQLGELEGQSGTRVWTQHFGSQCEPA
ncbi:MAG TPA: hypothetical protein VF729_07070 [Solirubrobacterales bacterium]